METHLPQTKALYFFIKKSNFYNTVYKILRALSPKRQFDTSLANKKFEYPIASLSNKKFGYPIAPWMEPWLDLGGNGPPNFFFKYIIYIYMDINFSNFIL